MVASAPSAHCYVHMPLGSRLSMGPSSLIYRLVVCRQPAGHSHMPPLPLHRGRRRPVPAAASASAGACAASPPITPRARGPRNLGGGGGPALCWLTGRGPLGIRRRSILRKGGIGPGHWATAMAIATASPADWTWNWTRNRTSGPLGNWTGQCPHLWNELHGHAGAGCACAWIRNSKETDRDQCRSDTGILFFSPRIILV